jgi:protein Tex
VITNVTAFGAFIDVGVHQDGLAHVSQLSDSFVRDAAEAVKVGQRVMATVMEVDIQRKRIALSLKSKPDFERKQGGGGGGPRPAGQTSGQGRPGGFSQGGGRPGGGGGGFNNNPFGGLGGGSSSGGGGNDWFSQASKSRK